MVDEYANRERLAKWKRERQKPKPRPRAQAEHFESSPDFTHDEIREMVVRLLQSIRDEPKLVLFRKLEALEQGRPELRLLRDKKVDFCR